MGSTRLPGKVMKKLIDKPVLHHVVDRLKTCKQIDSILVATTLKKEDAEILNLCEKIRIPCFRGSENDVLDRYYQAARSVKATTIIRITSDCPLLDPILVDNMVEIFMAEQNSLDYLSNTLERTFPRGLDTEIFSMSALAKAWSHASSAAEREHVTPYIYRHPEMFRLRNHKNSIDLSSYRWTLDTPEDWRFIKEVYTRLYDREKIFLTDDIIDLLKEEPEIAAANANVVQKDAGI